LNPREENNEDPFRIALVGLAISFALPMFGQQKETLDAQAV
jgi:hypothetical protein